MVTNLQKCSEEDYLKIYTNGGVLEYNQMGDFVHLPLKIYYNPLSIANILSLKAVSEIKGYRVSMDTSEDPSIRLHHGNETLRFPHSRNGLYYCTVEEMNSFSSKVRSAEQTSSEPNKTDQHVLFLQTHTKADVDKADVDKATRVRESQQ